VKVFEALAAAFAAEEVTDVFSVMGDGNMYWQIALRRDHGTRIFAVRHEGAALAMADGYARAGGRVGVCAVTCGPGLTQLTTSLKVAAAHRTPVVVFAGDTGAAGKRMGGGQDIDQQPVVEAASGYFQPLRSPATVAEDVQRAFYVARTQCRPVVLNAPIDTQDANASSEFRPRPSSELLTAPQRIFPDPVLAAEAADLLASARRPILIAGAGAVAAGALPALRELGERCGALLATTVLAKGAFAGDPWDIGLVGGYADLVGEPFFATADLVLGVGTSFDPFSTRQGTLYPAARVIAVDRGPHVLVSGRRAPDLHLQSDGRAGIETILSVLVERKHRATGFRTADVASELQRDARELDLLTSAYEVEPGRLDPRRLMLELDAALPGDCTILVGVGHFWSFPTMFLRGGRGRQFLYTYDWGTIGQALPTAIGAAVAQPGRPLIVFEGDTSLMMHVQELDTAARYCFPILLFVMNDDALGAEYHRLKAQGLPFDQALLAGPDFARVGAAFGVRGVTLDHEGAAAGVVADALEAPGLTIVDARISNIVMSLPYRRNTGWQPTLQRG
jgi:acetolactate synthase I/II/III large subunit